MPTFNARHNRTSLIQSSGTRRRGEAPSLSVKNCLNWTLTNQDAPCFFNRFPGPITGARPCWSAPAVGREYDLIWQLRPYMEAGGVGGTGPKGSRTSQPAGDTFPPNCGFDSVRRSRRSEFAETHTHTYTHALVGALTLPARTLCRRRRYLRCVSEQHSFVRTVGVGV